MKRWAWVLAATAIVVGACAGDGATGASLGATSSTQPTSAGTNGVAEPSLEVTQASLLPIDSSGTWSTFQSGTVDQDIVVDTSGFVWAVGQGGAVRIDPTDLTYTLFSTDDGLVDTFVLDAEAHPDGSVWLQTMSGLSVWVDGRFTAPPWESSPPPWVLDPLAHPPMELAEIDEDGRVWFVGHQSVAAFDGGQWIEFEAPETVDPLSGFAVDADGAAWINGWDGLYRLDQASFVRFDHPYEGWNVWDMDADARAGIWIAATEPTYFDGTSMEEFPGAHGRTISIDDEGGVWMASEEVFHLVDGEWVGIDVGGWSEALAVRSPSEVWIAHQQHPTVARVQNGEVTRIEITELTQFADVGIESDGSGRTYVAGRRGESIRVRQNGQWVNYPTPPAGFSPAILVGDSSSGLWAASPVAGVAFCDGESWSIVIDPQAMPPGELSAFAVSPEGQPVVGTFADEHVLLSWWSGSDFDVVDITDALAYPLPILHIRGMSEDGMWIGTYGELVRIDGSSPISIPPGGFTGNMIHDMAVGHDGAVWIAHGDGLDRFKDGEWWSTYSGEDVELSIAYGVDVAPNGAVWAAGYGAYRFDGANWTIFRGEDGVASRTLMSVEASADGSVWFTTDKSGLTRWVPES